MSKISRKASLSFLDSFDVKIADTENLHGDDKAPDIWSVTAEGKIIRKKGLDESGLLRIARLNKIKARVSSKKKLK